MDINYTDMLSRKLDNFIEKHYANNKSALLLKGARLVGKTSAIRKYTAKQKMNLRATSLRAHRMPRMYCCVYLLTQKRRHHCQTQ